MRFFSAQLLLALVAVFIAFVSASAHSEDGLQVSSSNGPDRYWILMASQIRATNASAIAASSSSSVAAEEATGSGYPGGVGAGSGGGGDTGGLGNTPNSEGDGTANSSSTANGPTGKTNDAAGVGE